MPFTKTRNRFIIFIVGGGRYQSVIPRNNNNGTRGCRRERERTCGFAGDANGSANGQSATMKESSCLLSSPLLSSRSRLYCLGSWIWSSEQEEEEGAKDAIFSSTQHKKREREKQKEVGDKEGSISCHKNKIGTD